MSRKTLAEELAELANPAPRKEFDPDTDIFGSGPALEASDDELLATTTVKSRGKERSRLRGDILLPGKDYSGKKSSRAALYGEDDDDDDEEGDDDDEEEEEEDDSLEGDEDDSEEESDEEELENGVSKKEPVYKKQSKKVANDEEESESEEEEDEAAALEREYREMQRQEADARAGLEERAAKERRKGQAVHAQSSLWNSGLELRILLQRALQAGNRLPQPDAHRVTVEVDAELAAGLRGLARDATGVVRELTALLTSMEEQHPAIEEAAQAAGVVKKRKTREGDEDDENDEGEGEEEKTESDRLWDELDAAYRHFAPFRDASIDRWHRKTVLSSGSAARGGLKVLNQSVSSQVELLMRDAHRVVERTRLPKRQCLALCSVEEDKGVFTEMAEASELDMADGDDRDPETYDDGDFYQTLLKEFFEGKQDTGTNWYTGPKQRKLVDRRASKGRKLRYHIHDKLANFMTPVELHAPQFASNIFANLFGGATGGRK